MNIARKLLLPEESEERKKADSKLGPTETSWEISLLSAHFFMAETNPLRFDDMPPPNGLLQIFEEFREVFDTNNGIKLSLAEHFESNDIAYLEQQILEVRNELSAATESRPTYKYPYYKG